jgi:hypothetical protein
LKDAPEEGLLDEMIRRIRKEFKGYDVRFNFGDTDSIKWQIISNDPFYKNPINVNMGDMTIKELIERINFKPE